MNGKIAIAPVPVFEEGMPRSLGLGGTGTVVTNYAVDKDLVGEFVAYAKLSEDANRMIWEDLGFDPCNTSLWTDREMTHNPENRYNQYFLNNAFDVLLEIKDEIQMVRSTSISPTINQYLTTVMLNELFEDLLDPLKLSSRLSTTSKTKSSRLSQLWEEGSPSHTFVEVRGRVRRITFHLQPKSGAVHLRAAVRPDLPRFCLSRLHHHTHELSGDTPGHDH